MDMNEVLAKLRIQYQSPIWQTREGNFIPIVLMEIGHLERAYKMVCHNLEEEAYAYDMIYDSVWGLPEDGMAFDAATSEEEWWRHNRKPILEAWIKAFEAEFTRRNLSIPGHKPIQKMPKVKNITYVDGGKIIELEKSGEHG